jgi:hypothetical protein
MPDYFALKALKSLLSLRRHYPDQVQRVKAWGFYVLLSAYSQPSFAPLSSPLKPLYLIFHFLV